MRDDTQYRWDETWTQFFVDEGRRKESGISHTKKSEESSQDNLKRLGDKPNIKRKKLNK